MESYQSEEEFTQQFGNIKLSSGVSAISEGLEPDAYNFHKRDAVIQLQQHRSGFLKQYIYTE
jgi:hypothetical protein